MKSHWWSNLKSYQRELAWTAMIGLASIALFAVCILLASALWPNTLTTWNGTVILMIVGALVGTGSGLAGMLLGYRIEDRRKR